MSVPVRSGPGRAPGARGPAVLRHAAAAGVVLLGVAGGYGATVLAASARSYCDAAWEPQHRLVFTMVDWPVMQLFGLLMAVGAWAGARHLTARLPIAWRGLLPAGLVLLALAVLTVGSFAYFGTLDAYPGDSGLCPPDNVPPWWPTWLPA
ncbi:hypothetical protein ACIRBX_23195 [Kitasatospora sp. NPDC096147]|uniref:hypothetical protein n=1 Tax=Kitasatospora sp. NPDC096147 TaxID=3364093 RepID=UPI00380FEBEE